MIVTKPGHTYELENFEGSPPQTIQFIHKDIQDDPTNRDTTNLVTIKDGTTNEEVLSVMVNRMQHLQINMPCRENAIVITKIEEALMWLNKRTQDRIDRNVVGTYTE